MKKGTSDHPKTVDLSEHLKINRAWVCGILELLWNFTRDYAPEGDVGRFSDAAIARAVHWPKSASTLISALIQFRFLDRCPQHRLVIHDWSDHCDDYTRKKLKRSGSDFTPCLTKSGKCPDKVQTNLDLVSGQFSTHARAEPLPVPEPVPLPVPSRALDSADTPHPPDAIDAKPKPQSFAAHGYVVPMERSMFDEIAARMYKRHAKKDGKILFEQALACVLADAGDNAATVAQSIEAAHEKQCEYWKSNYTGPSFWPKLADWVRDGKYLDDVADSRAPVALVRGGGQPVTFAERNEEIRRQKFAARMREDLNIA